MGYLAHWGLTEKPFEEVNDPRFFFASEDHREALDRMYYVVNDHNMNISLLTGEIGCGKTITKKVLLTELPADRFEILDFENSSFAFVDLVYDIVCRLAAKHPRAPGGDGGADPLRRGDKYSLLRIFKEQLSFLYYEEKRHLILIFDEAQQIEDAALDEIRTLTNYSTAAENLLTIFMIGQPELREKVKRLRQLDQRIFLRFHLNNLDFNGTAGYIGHRLLTAGRTEGGPFAPPALELIFRGTGGVPREINRICKLALNYGFAQGRDEISLDDVQLILDDMKAHG